MIALRPVPLRTLARCTRGIALTEFAFALPIFLFLLLGGLEITNFVMAHARVNQIAITAADNAGRVRSGIDESNIYEVFSGVALVGQSLDFADNGRVVLSSLEPNGLTGPDEGQMINWQRCYGSLSVAPLYGRQGKGRSNSNLEDGMGPAGSEIRSGSGTAVMFVEVTYQYEPLFFGLLESSSNRIRYESAFNVRERTNQAITNTQNLAVNSC
jgi:hypothetical protein